MSMLQRIVLASASISLIVVVGMFVISGGSMHIIRAEPAQATLMLIPTRPNNVITPIVDFNPTTVSKLALLYTNALFPSLSGTPKIVLARDIKKSEFPLVGIDDLPFVNESTPMVVIVIKGDFDISAQQGSVPIEVRRTRASYICYLFQKGTDGPTLTFPSVNGGSVRKLLNDPTIPLDPTVVPYDKGTPYTGPDVGMPVTPSPLTTPDPRYYAPPINTPTLSK